MKTSVNNSAPKQMLGMIGILIALLYSSLSLADVLDPNCTVEKAAKSAASKATIGVGGRCSPAEVAKDSVKKATNVDTNSKVKRTTK